MDLYTPMYLMIIMHTRFSAKLNNILCCATLIETGKQQEIYYIRSCPCGDPGRSAMRVLFRWRLRVYRVYQQCLLNHSAIFRAKMIFVYFRNTTQTIIMLFLLFINLGLFNGCVRIFSIYVYSIPLNWKLLYRN